MTILLHVCCGPCATAVVEKLLSLKETVTMFYYNPNTYPLEEYVKRFKNAGKVAQYFNVPIINAVQPEQWKKEHDKWREKIKGMENLKEGGARCAVCYEHRLCATAMYAKKNGFSSFATTLGIGPMKPVDKINRIGMSLAQKYGLHFVAENFRKHKGHERTVALSKKLKLYRQTYCGCEFSI